MRSFICEICTDEFPEALHHQHHKVPKSLGGSDAPTNLVDLCQTDHQLLHSIAYMLVNKKRKHEVEPTLNSVYPGDIIKQKKVLEYAHYVAREMVLKKEIKKEPDQETRMSVELPALYLDLLRLAGYDHPHANGKPRGTSALLRIIVAQFLCRRFPLRRDEILNLHKRDSKK